MYLISQNFEDGTLTTCILFLHKMYVVGVYRIPFTDSPKLITLTWKYLFPFFIWNFNQKEYNWLLLQSNSFSWRVVTTMRKIRSHWKENSLIPTTENKIFFSRIFPLRDQIHLPYVQILNSADMSPNKRSTWMISHKL